MRKTTLLIFGICIVFLTGCSGVPPRSLRYTADNAMNTFFVELANEYEVYSGAEMVDFYQISETEWCLAYTGGESLHTATIWKNESDGWQRIELRNYTDNCGWAH